MNDYKTELWLRTISVVICDIYSVTVNQAMLVTVKHSKQLETICSEASLCKATLYLKNMIGTTNYGILD
jgi:hypothetical protein